MGADPGDVVQHEMVPPYHTGYQTEHVVHLVRGRSASARYVV